MGDRGAEHSHELIADDPGARRPEPFHDLAHAGHATVDHVLHILGIGAARVIGEPAEVGEEYGGEATFPARRWWRARRESGSTAAAEAEPARVRFAADGTGGGQRCAAGAAEPLVGGVLLAAPGADKGLGHGPPLVAG